MRAPVVALAVVAGLAVAGCSGSDTGPRAVVRVTGSRAAGCAHPTAKTATYLPTPAGSPGIPRVGPLTFSPALYQPPHPDKVLVVRVSALPADALSLTGYNCDDGRALRFWYLTSGAVPGPLDKNPGEGQQVAVLPYASRFYTGYMLFTEPGRWSIVVSDRGKVLGNLVMTVATGCRGGPQYC